MGSILPALWRSHSVSPTKLHTTLPMHTTRKKLSFYDEWSSLYICKFIKSSGTKVVGEITLWCRRLRCKNITSLQGSISPTFYVQLLRTWVARTAFCAYILGLYFTGARLLVQKLRAERRWNWPQAWLFPLTFKVEPYCRLRERVW